MPVIPERRLRPVPRKASARLAGKTGLRGARFYYSLEGKKFVAKTYPAVMSWKIFVFAFDVNNERQEHATALLSRIRGGNLRISDLKRLATRIEQESSKGEMVFRAVLREATRVAKQRKANISIRANNKKLRSYYQKFGFVFKPNSMYGLLVLFREKEAK